MPRFSRRQVLAALTAAPWFSLQAQSTTEPWPVPAPTGPSPPIELWNPGVLQRRTDAQPTTLVTEYLDRNASDNPVRDRLVRQVTAPVLFPFLATKPSGLAALIIPGGGYRHVVIDKEGFETAAWLAARGVNAYVLLYRLPHDGWVEGSRAPLADAQQALRVIRERAAADGHARDRVFVEGFSAGGHLAAWLATGGGEASAIRPDAAVLLYPVIKLAGPFAHSGSATRLLGEFDPAAGLASHEPDRLVDGSTPPTMVVHALDDNVVPADNSLAFLAALRAAGRPAQAHFFATGGHGFGIRYAIGKPAAAWMPLTLDWVEQVLPGPGSPAGR